MTENEIARVVVDAAFRIHKRLGPGLLESAYHAILLYELRKSGFHVDSEVPVQVMWEAICIDVGFRADLIVEHKVVVELKSIEAVLPVHKKQLLTYLRMTNRRLGLLLNFGAETIKEGISRVVNGLDESDPA